MIPYIIVDHFSLGPFKFYTWGFFIALAFLVGLILILRQAKKIGVSANKIIWLIIFVYLGAIIGGRLFFILQSPLDFLRAPALILQVSGGGMMFYGGLVGGVAAGFLYLRKILAGWSLVNVIVPVIPISMAIGRIGCFLNNDHQGGITSVPWAILWPDGTLRHPVALYLILFDLALAGGLWLWGKYGDGKKEDLCHSRESGNPDAVPAKAGIRTWIPAQGRNDKPFISPFLLFLLLYPLGRFFLDFTRDFSADPHFFGLASSQWISLVILTGVLLYTIIKYKNLLRRKNASKNVFVGGNSGGV